MATPHATDQRRSSAVWSLPLRGLASLSFGKVLIGAAMVWMAAIFISAQAGSGSAEPDAAASPAVELVAYDDQNSDAADEADWSFSFGAGENKSAPANNGGRPAAKLGGHMATMATATPARSLAELRARHSPVATEPMAADTAEWPFGVRHDGHSGGQRPVATPSASTAPDPAGPMSRMVHSEVEPTIDSALEFVAKLINRLAGATTGATDGGSDEPLADAPPWSRPSPSGNRSSSSRALPAPAAERVDELVGGVVDLASGIVGTVAGQRAGARTRQALTDIAEQVSTALAAGNRLGRHGGAGSDPSEFQPAMHERAAKQTPHGGGPGVTPERGQGPITCQALGCPAPNPGLNGRDPGVGGGRGPPVDHRARYQHDSPDENDPASRAGTIDNFIEDLLRDLLGDLHRNSDGNNGGAGQAPRPSDAGNGDHVEDIRRLAEDFVSSLLKLLGIDGGPNGNAGEAGQAPRGSSGEHGDPGPFSDDMDYWKGLYHDAFMAEANAANQQQGARRQAPDLGQAMDRFNELASGLVADVAGRDAGKQTRQALGALSDRLRAGDAANGGDPERTARRADLDADRASSIQELAQGFVTDLLESLGLARPRETGAGQAAPPGRQPPDGLGGDIAELTDDFVSDLLEMLGGSTPSGGGSGSGSGGPGASGGGVQPPEGLDEFAQLLGGVTDLVSGLVGTVAGERAGTQARELLTAAAQDVLAALAAGQNGGTGGAAGQNGGQAAPGAGQENSWGLNNDGQFAGTPCEGEVECALATYDLRTRQPQSLANRGPPQLLNDSTSDTEQALEDRLALVKGEKSLKAAKADLKAGEISKAAYEKKAAAHKKLRAEADRSAARLDPYDAQLLDDVVTGQRELGPAKTKLAESKKQLNAGKISQATYDRRSAAYREQRDEVYGQTARLRELAGYGDAVRADPGRDGAGAACANTGAFAECSTAVIDPKTGEVREDQSFCLLGLSGCASKSKIGNRTATATCDPEKGCTTSGKAGRTTARTECGAGECNTAATAATGGTVTFCQARNGCAEHGRTPTPPAAKGKKPGVSGTDSECTEDCALAAFANLTEAGADCATRNGKCDNTSTGRLENRAAGNLTAKGEATSEAHCRASAIGCDTTTAVRAGIDPATGQQGWLAGDQNSSGEAAAEAIVRCATGAKGCLGNAETSTGGRTKQTPAGADAERRSHTGTARCTVKRGGCTASSGLGETDEMLAYSDIDCAAKGCKGKASTATKAKITTGTGDDKATRKTAAEHKCKVRGTTGDCANDASSAVANPGPDGPTADSRTIATLACGSADCKARESGSTSGQAEDDVKGKRDSDGVTGCATYGVDGTCGSAAETTVAYRQALVHADGRAIPAGVVSESHADAQVRCREAKDCGGKSYAETSALDTSVSKHRRGSSDTAACTVRGGGCLGQTSSDASSAADYVKLDPATGQPLKGQPKSGPTSTSRASASVDCRAADCEGTAHTEAAAWDGGRPRTSEGTVTCEKGATTCQMQTLSNATTGPGAALTYAGDDAEPNTKRLGKGPSAASTIGGKLTGEGGGRLTGTVLATNPGVSPEPRGNKAEGSCAGATGGSCTAVINGGSSTGPDANTIKPMVTDSPTSNATSTNTQVGGTTRSGDNATASQGGQNPSGQPGQNPNQPATAPGSSASTGGPSVPGASSWTTAWAALNCTGDTPCQGSPRSSATGITGDDHRNGGEGSRGPPAGRNHATGKTTATCDTTGSACQALSNSSAASGQVVADILTEQNKAAVEQAKAQAAQARQTADKAKQAAEAPGATKRQQKAADQAGKAEQQAKKAAASAAKAIKKPLPESAVPANWSRSASFAQCTGPGCQASTAGETTGVPGTSHTTASCTAAASGCAVTSDATATLMRGSGQRTKPIKTDQDGKLIPGASGTGQTSSQLSCPDAGCTGKLTGTVSATAGQGSHRSISTGKGSTACDGTGPCQAEIQGNTSRQLSGPGVAEERRFAGTSVSIKASCDDGTKTGCPVRASSRTDAGQGLALNAKSSANCGTAGGCTAATGGLIRKDLAEVNATCAGTDCRTRTSGTTGPNGAVGGAGKSRSECTAGTDGVCMGSTSVAPAGTQAAAACRAAKGCRYSAGVSASASAPSDSWADGHARGSGRGKQGRVAVSASAFAQGSTAQVGATCTGAKNCDTGFTAHAEENFYEEFPGLGYKKGNGWGTCTGGGPSGGKCAVTASAAAGGARCTGDCDGFTQGGSPIELVITGDGVVVDENGDPIDIDDLGKDEEAIYVGPSGKEGEVEVKIKKKGEEEVEEFTVDCGKKCTESEGGFEYGYNGEEYTAGMPAPGSDKNDKCAGTKGCGLSRDAQGDGGGWVAGTGSATNGSTGERTEFTEAPDVKKQRSYFRLSDSDGSPFRAICNADCEYWGKDLPGKNSEGDEKKQDHLKFEGTRAVVQGRDKNGNSAMLWLTGKATFTSAEGDKLVLEGENTGSAEIATRNSQGLGGYMILKPSKKEDSGKKKDGKTVNGYIVTSDGVGLDCDDCKYGAHYFGQEKGAGGVNMCTVAQGGSACYGATNVEDIDDIDRRMEDMAYQEVTVDKGKKGTAEFVQYLPNADGSEGGAVAFTTGHGHAYGADAYGNWIETPLNTRKKSKSGMVILYAEKDGYNTGQACYAPGKGHCTGSADAEDRLDWVNPTKAVTAALGIREYAAPGCPVCEGGDSLKARGQAVFEFAFGQAHTKWMAETGNKQVEPLADAFAEAKKDGKITEAERDKLAGLLADTDPKLVDRWLRTEEAVANVLAVHAVTESVEDIERMLAADEDLLKEVLAGGGQTYDKGKDKDAQIDQAREILTDQQWKSTSLRNDLTDVQSDWKELQERQEHNQEAWDDYYRGRGGDRAELEAEQKKIDKAADQLEEKENGIREDLEDSQAILRGYDMAAAIAGGDKAYVDNIRLARDNAESVDGFVAALPDPETPEEMADTNRLAAVSNAIQAGYDAAITAPRSADNRLHNLDLPSTGSPDLALAMRAAAAYDWIKTLMDATNSPLVTQDSADEQPRDLTADEMANLAAHWAPKAGMSLPEIAREPGKPTTHEEVIAFIAGLAGEDSLREATEGDPKKVSIIQEFFSQANLAAGSYRAAAGVLSGKERERLDNFQDEVDPKSFTGFFDFLGDGATLMNKAAVRDYNRAFGYGTDNFWRNLGRSAVSSATGTIGFIGGTLPGGLVTEMSNNRDPLATLGVDPPKLVGESDEAYNARIDPVSTALGGMAKQSGDLLEDAFTGNFDRLGHKFHLDPIGTSMGLALPVLIVFGPATAGLRGAAGRAAASSAMLREAGLSPVRASALEARAANLTTAARFTSVPMHLALAPNYLLGLPSRAAALGARSLAIPGARLAQSGAMAATLRAANNEIAGETAMTGLWSAASKSLSGGSRALARGAEHARMYARYGWGGLGIPGVYRTLGIDRAAAKGAVDAAYQARLTQLDRRWVGAPARWHGGPDPALAARSTALDTAMSTVRETRAKQAIRVFTREAAKARRAAAKASVLPGRAKAARAAAAKAAFAADKAARRANQLTASAVKAAVKAENTPTAENRAKAAEKARQARDARANAARSRADATARFDRAAEATAAERRAEQLARQADAATRTAIGVLKAARAGPDLGDPPLLTESLPAGTPLLRRIHIMLDRNDGVPLTLARVARELGVKKSAVRNAIRAATAEEGAGLRVDERRHSPATVRRIDDVDRSGQPTGGARGPGRGQAGDRPGPDNQPDGNPLPPAQGAGNNGGGHSGQGGSPHGIDGQTPGRGEVPAKGTGSENTSGHAPPPDNRANHNQHGVPPPAGEGTSQRPNGELRRQYRDLFNDVSSGRRSLTDDGVLKELIGLFLEAYRMEHPSFQELYPHQTAALNSKRLAKLVRSWEKALSARTVLGRKVRGLILELRTGAGKTLVQQALGSWLALEGRGVHLVTHDEVKAKSLYEQLRPVQRRLGKDVGLITQGMTDAELRAAYRKSITVGERTVFEHNYLADMQLGRGGRKVQGQLRWYVVDEADDVLNFQALNPSVLAVPEVNPGKGYYSRRDIEDAVQTVFGLRNGHRVTSAGRVRLTAEGWNATGDLSRRQRKLVMGVLQALVTHAKNHDHIVDGAVVLHSEATGRANRHLRFNGDDQRILEAVYGLTVHEAQKIVSSITTRKYLKQYTGGLIGLTATAQADSKFFRKHYRAEVEPIEVEGAKAPVDTGFNVYRTQNLADAATVRETLERSRAGQPTLIGVTTIPHSEALARTIAEGLAKDGANGVEPGVINALPNRAGMEEQTVAGAARPGAVTVGTRAAGRATDILSGGDQTRLGLTDAEHQAPMDQVEGAGGLHVGSTTKGETPSQDTQLFGRTARDGHDGSTGENLSLEDPLLTRSALKKRLEALKAETKDQPGKLTGEQLTRARNLFKEAQRDAQKANRAKHRAINRSVGKADAVAVANGRHPGRIGTWGKNTRGSRARAAALRENRAVTVYDLATDLARHARQGYYDALGRSMADPDDRVKAEAVRRAVRDMHRARQRQHDALTAYRGLVGRPDTWANHAAAFGVAVPDGLVELAAGLIGAGRYGLAGRLLLPLATHVPVLGPDGRAWLLRPHATATAAQALRLLDGITRLGIPGGAPELRQLNATIDALRALAQTLPTGARMSTTASSIGPPGSPVGAVEEAGSSAQPRSTPEAGPVERQRSSKLPGSGAGARPGAVTSALLVGGGGLGGAAVLGLWIPAMVLGGVGIAVAGAGLVRMLWHPAQARGPPLAWLAIGLSLVLSAGLSLFGVPVLALLAGGIVLSVPLAARLLVARAGSVRKAAVVGLISLLALTGVTDTSGANRHTSFEAVSVSTEQVTVESEARPSEFLIVPGDTATSVTDRLDVTQKAMAAANPQVTDWNLILAGQHVNLPESWPGTFELDRDLWSVADRFGIEDADGDNGWRQVREWNAAKIADRPLDALPEGLELTVVAPAPDHPDPSDHPGPPELPGQPDPAGPEQPAPGSPWPTLVTGLAIGLGAWLLLVRWKGSRPDGAGSGGQSINTSGRIVAWLVAGAGALVAALTMTPLVTVLQVGAGALFAFAAARAARDLWKEQDTPLMPGQRRTWLAAGSLFGLGLGGALMTVGPLGVWEAAGFGLLVASLGTAAKVGRSARWYRKNRAGPPATGSRAARVAAAAGLVLTGVAAGWAAPWLPEWLGTVIGWVGQQPNGKKTALLVISAIVISAPLNYRYVKYRKIWNLDKGTFAKPRQNALLGAVLAAVPAIMSNLVQLSAVPVLVGFFAQFNWAAAAVVAFLGTFFQRRQMGGQLTWNAGSDAVYAVPIAFLLAALQWAQPTASWAEYLTAIGWWVAAVAPAAMLIDYWIYYLALPVEKLSRWMHKRSRATARRIRAGASEETSRWRVAQLRNRNHRRLDFETFSHPNWLVSFWKSPDSITKAVLTYFIVRPIPGVPENGYSITLRILVAIGVLVLSWRTRNVIELLLGILGYLSPRSMARRSRPIGWFWRLTRRADPHPRWFWRLFGHWPYAHRVADLLEVAEADLAGDAQLPATLAERLVESLLHDLPPPVELEKLSKDHAAQVTEVKDQWSLVDEKTRRALSLVLLLVATNREALTGAAGRIDGRVGDVVGFVDRLADALPGIFDSLALTDADRERLGLGSGAPLSRTVLEKLLLEAIKDLYAQRLVYLRDHLLPLLYAWRGELPRASEEGKRAEMWILYTEGEMELAARPKIDPRGFVAARNLIAEQNERVRENRKTEQVRSPAVAGDPTAPGWIKRYRRNSDALLVLDASLAILEEVELHRAERAYWRERLALAVATTAPAPENLLAVLLTAASRNDPLTARDLADRYQGSVAGWQRMLNDLAGAGLLAGDATNGYTVTDELRKAWRAARPKLRHALRANPELLPGGGRLQPLLQRTSWSEAGTKRAHDALLDLLAMGHQVLYSRADPGFIEDVRRRWQAIYGRFYERGHPLSAAEQAPKPDRDARRKQLTGAVQELTNAIQVVQDRREEALRAEFGVKQQLYAADPNRDQTGRPDLRATDPKEVFDAKSEFDRINQALEKALEKLGKIVDRIRDEDYPHVGARPPKLSILLEDADSLLAMGAGQIAPVPAEIELRRSVEALVAADRALARAGTPEEREAALHQARVALIRFRYAARTIREKGATIRLRAWWHVRVGERRARKLIEHDRPALVPAFALPTGHETAAAGSVPLDLPGGAGAAMSNPGTMPHARNHDFADAHYDPVTGVITVVVADGLSAGFQSELAARLAVRTALAELTRTDRKDRTPRQAHRFAAAMAAARVAAMARPGQAYPPATTYLAVQVFPGKGRTNRVVVSNLGDTHAYIERNGHHTRLTFNHADSATGGLTGFLGENPLVPPYVRTYRPRKSGHLLLATDGLHIHHLDKLLKDAAFAPDDTPAERVRRLIDAGRDAGGRDNLTAVDIPFPFSPPPGGHNGPLAWYLDRDWVLAIEAALREVTPTRSVRPQEYGWSSERGPPEVVVVNAAELAERLDEVLGAGTGARVTANLIAYTLGGRIYVLDTWWDGFDTERKALVIAHEHGAHITGEITDHDAHARATLDRLGLVEPGAPAHWVDAREIDQRIRTGAWGTVRPAGDDPVAQAISWLWAKRGMAGRPRLVNASDRQSLLASGHIPVYRGLAGAHAEQHAEAFSTGDRPHVGEGLVGSGHYFASWLPRAMEYTGSPEQPGRFGGTVLVAYLHRDSSNISEADAKERRTRDVEAAEGIGLTSFAAALERDLGLWAAWRGIDSIGISGGGSHVGAEYDVYVVQNRSALFVERVDQAGSPAELAQSRLVRAELLLSPPPDQQWFKRAAWLDQVATLLGEVESALGVVPAGRPRDGLLARFEAAAGELIRARATDRERRLGPGVKKLWLGERVHDYLSFGGGSGYLADLAERFGAVDQLAEAVRAESSLRLVTTPTGQERVLLVPAGAVEAGFTVIERDGNLLLELATRNGTLVIVADLLPQMVANAAAWLPSVLDPTDRTRWLLGTIADAHTGAHDIESAVETGHTWTDRI